MSAILQFISSHWVEWIFTVAVAALGWGYKKIYSRVQTEQEKNDAIAKGVQCLLRESIVSNYNKYSDKGACPIYAKESLKSAYTAYHELGGNDVATGLYHKLLEMPEETQEKKE